jgi:hypothetical protein
MNEPSFEVRSFLICDEVRNEVSSKQLIIGAYAGLILMPFVPFIARIFTIRFEVLANQQHFDHVQCTVTRPNNTTFYHSDKPFNIPYPQYPMPIVFENLFANFEHVGDYQVFLAMDSAPRHVGSFKIVTREQLSLDA